MITTLNSDIKSRGKTRLHSFFPFLRQIKSYTEHVHINYSTPASIHTIIHIYDILPVGYSPDTRQSSGSNFSQAPSSFLCREAGYQ